MLRYLLPLIVLVFFTLYLYSMEPPTQHLLLKSREVYVKEMYYLVIEKTAGIVSKEVVSSEVVTEPSLDLTYGLTPSPLVLVKSENEPPPRYIKLVSYDEYTGRYWSLKHYKGLKEYIIKVTYKVLHRRGSCYTLKEDIKFANTWVGIRWSRLIVCYGINEPYIKIKTSNSTLFKLRNETLAPLPYELLTQITRSTRFNESMEVIPVILYAVIPIPKESVKKVTLTLIIDPLLRYVKIRGSDIKNVESILILKNNLEEARKLRSEVLRSVTYICPRNYSNVASLASNNVLTNDSCLHKAIGAMYRSICNYTSRYVSLNTVTNKLISMINKMTSYGDVDLSLYTNSSCRDLVGVFLLRAKRGVCIHYASALSLMLKILGFNSRVTSGLLRIAFVRLNNSNEYLGFYSPHAWSEVFLKYGYISFDPTPASAEGVIPSRTTAINIYRAYKTKEEGEEPYSGINVKVRYRERGIVVDILGSLSKNYRRFLSYLYLNIMPEALLIIIAFVVLTNTKVSGLITKLLSLLRIKLAESKSLATIVLNEVYKYVGVRMPVNLTLREHVKFLSKYLNRDSLELLKNFVHSYEAFYYGGIGNINEVRHRALHLIRRLKTNATSQ